jgi:hypothetical protein
MDVKVVIKGTILGLSLLSQSVSAGFVSNTAHSRANCGGFNESITWNGSQSHWWRVLSIHFAIHQFSNDHSIDTGMHYTWRAAAYHMKEWGGKDNNNWWVQGYHYYHDGNKEVYDNYTEACDCAIYDGWWDKNIKPPVDSISGDIK